MKKRRLILIPIISLFASLLLLGTGYAAWTSNTANNVNEVASVNVPEWEEEPDWAKYRVDASDEENHLIDNTNLTPSIETTILSPRRFSTEAIRFTNTTGKQKNKEHVMTVTTDQTYLLGDIKTFKVAFDYYHEYRREQYGIGFPKVTLMSKNNNGTYSTKGNTQGGTDSCTSTSVFTAETILDKEGNDTGWWHLEYFITALCPTMSDHGDSVPSESTKINGIKISDVNIYDYNDVTAFVVLDNVQFTDTLSDRLGLFNRGTSFKLTTGYYWFKIAWAGTLNSCTMSFSDSTVMEQDTRPEATSPFYIHALKKGTAVATATLDIGPNHQILSISNTITVN